MCVYVIEKSLLDRGRFLKAFLFLNRFSYNVIVYIHMYALTSQHRSPECQIGIRSTTLFELFIALKKFLIVPVKKPKLNPTHPNVSPIENSVKRKERDVIVVLKIKDRSHRSWRSRNNDVVVVLVCLSLFYKSFLSLVSTTDNFGNCQSVVSYVSRKNMFVPWNGVPGVAFSRNCRSPLFRSHFRTYLYCLVP